MVKQLRPITFDWKESGMHDIGFGAEDVAKVSELLVIHNTKGEVEGVKYDRISAVLVNAVNEQQAMLQRQQQQLERLELTVKHLKALACSKNSRAAICRER